MRIPSKIDDNKIELKRETKREIEKERQRKNKL